MNRKPTYEELAARVRELEHAAGFRPETSDPDIIRTLSESFQQLADRSQDAIYLFDIESGTFPFFNKRFLSLYGGRKAGRATLSSASVAQHIHQQKQIAEDLRDKEKLRAILEMAGAVSHELNNPLQVVLIGIRKLEDATKDYVQGKKIVDIDAAANKK